MRPGPIDRQPFACANGECCFVGCNCFLEVVCQIAVEPVVGFAASFPFSTSQLTTSYRVNETWFQQMLDEMPDDEDDDDQ